MCAKIVQVKVYPEKRPENSLHLYALIDDQSSRTLGKSQFFNHFGESGSKTEYILSSCYIAESLEDATCFKLPTLLECDDIPNIRHKIPTPDAARFHQHLADIAQFIPPINPSAAILILIGRDLPAVYHIHDQRIGPPNGPFAHRTGLGWTINRILFLRTKRTYLEVVVHQLWNRAQVNSSSRSFMTHPTSLREQVTTTYLDYLYKTSNF